MSRFNISPARVLHRQVNPKSGASHHVLHGKKPISLFPCKTLSALAKSFLEPLPGIHLSLGTQSARIVSESTFQAPGVVGWLRVQWKREQSSAQKRRL